MAKTPKNPKEEAEAKLMGLVRSLAIEAADEDDAAYDRGYAARKCQEREQRFAENTQNKRQIEE